MEEKKNIDQLFQERLKILSTILLMRENIAAKLDEKEKPAVFPLWWKIAE
jgi:hypothetical protein